MKNILSIFLITTILGCKNNMSVAQNEVSFTKFSSEQNINPKQFINFLQNRGVRMFVYDSLLIVKNSSSLDKNYHLYIYNVNSRKLVDSLFKIGSNKDEIISAFDMGLYKNKIWAYDISTQKMVFGFINRQIGETQNRLKEFVVKRPGFYSYYSVQVNDSLQLLANGDYINEHKIQQLNLSKGNLIKAFGTYDDKKDMPPMAWRAANEGFLYLQPNGEKLVSACRFADKIEIFDLRNNTNKIITGPENYEPQIDAVKSGDNYLVSRNEKTRFAFVKGYSTSKYIYLLYSGNNHMSEHLDYGKTIFVYDWEGNPIKKYNLPAYISCFAVSANDKEIYVFDVKEKQIKITNLGK